MSFMKPVALPAGLLTPTTAHPLGGHMSALQRRCTLPPLVREAWPIVELECEMADDQIPTYSGKYLRYNESRHEKRCESHVRVFILRCQSVPNISDAWSSDGRNRLRPVKVKIHLQP